MLDVLLVIGCLYQNALSGGMEVTYFNPDPTYKTECTCKNMIATCGKKSYTAEVGKNGHIILIQQPDW